MATTNAIETPLEPPQQQAANLSHQMNTLMEKYLRQQQQHQLQLMQQQQQQQQQQPNPGPAAPAFSQQIFEPASFQRNLSDLSRHTNVLATPFTPSATQQYHSNPPDQNLRQQQIDLQHLLHSIGSNISSSETSNPQPTPSLSRAQVISFFERIVPGVVSLEALGVELPQLLVREITLRSYMEASRFAAFLLGDSQALESTGITNTERLFRLAYSSIQNPQFRALLNVMVSCEPVVIEANSELPEGHIRISPHLCQPQDAFLRDFALNLLPLEDEFGAAFEQNFQEVMNGHDMDLTALTNFTNYKLYPSAISTEPPGNLQQSRVKLLMRKKIQEHEARLYEEFERGLMAELEPHIAHIAALLDAPREPARSTTVAPEDASNQTQFHSSSDASVPAGSPLTPQQSNQQRSYSPPSQQATREPMRQAHQTQHPHTNQWQPSVEPSTFVALPSLPEDATNTHSIPSCPNELSLHPDYSGPPSLEPLLSHTPLVSGRVPSLEIPDDISQSQRIDMRKSETIDPPPPPIENFRRTSEQAQESAHQVAITSPNDIAPLLEGPLRSRSLSATRQSQRSDTLLPGSMTTTTASRPAPLLQVGEMTFSSPPTPPPAHKSKRKAPHVPKANMKTESLPNASPSPSLNELATPARESESVTEHDESVDEPEFIPKRSKPSAEKDRQTLTPPKPKGQQMQATAQDDPTSRAPQLSAANKKYIKGSAASQATQETSLVVLKRCEGSVTDASLQSAGYVVRSSSFPQYAESIICQSCDHQQYYDYSPANVVAYFRVDGLAVTDSDLCDMCGGLINREFSPSTKVIHYCHTCLIPLDKRCDVIVHAQRHTNKRILVCSDCGQVMGGVARLRDHQLRRHTGSSAT